MALGALAPRGSRGQLEHAGRSRLERRYDAAHAPPIPVCRERRRRRRAPARCSTSPSACARRAGRRRRRARSRAAARRRLRAALRARRARRPRVRAALRGAAGPGRATMPTMQHREAPRQRARRGRGHYKVFLGMAAGVGKTYRMLQEGRAEQEAGRDVVIGLLETHGRAETAALADGLRGRPAPARRPTAAPTSRRWTCRRVLRRAPELCLIDELAHTNAPGRRARQALRGRRGRARRRHRRLLDGQRAAPRVAQRPGRRAHRRARARDGPRRRARPRPTRSCSSTSPRRRCSRGCGRARSTRPSASTPR